MQECGIGLQAGDTDVVCCVCYQRVLDETEYPALTVSMTRALKANVDARCPVCERLYTDPDAMRAAGEIMRVTRQ